MFNFVCKTLLLRCGRRCSITFSTTNYQHFAFPIFTNCVSTTTSNQHSFTVSYLINSCGLSLPSALSVSKHIHLESPEKPDSVIALFKSHGFSETQLSKVIRGHPRVLCLSPDKTLLPKLHFLKSKGFSSPDIAKICTICPKIVTRSLENHIIPSFNKISDLFQSTETAVAIVTLDPHILGNNVENHVVPIIDALRDVGVPERNIILFFRWGSGFYYRNSNVYRSVVDVVKGMGINPLSSHFILAVVAKLYGTTNWEIKMGTYRRWGWSEEEVLAAFCKNPLCMLASKDKIMTVMDFLVNQMEMEPSAIARRPDIISLSMKKRFIPRAAVFQFLLSKGLVNRENTNLITLFTVPEKYFLKKFVNGYDESPELLKLYKEKLGLLKMTTSASRKDAAADIVK